MVREATLTQTDAGLVPAGEGWFVLNARDARWVERAGRGFSLPLTGMDDQEAETLFPMLGIAIRVIAPGEPSTVYHSEADQEAFLVLSGEAIAVIEGQERALRQWDFVHCPPGTRHAFVGSGSEPCVLLCVGSRQLQAQGSPTHYFADELAAAHHAGAPQDTPDAAVAYARFGPSRPVPYRAGWLP